MWKPISAGKCTTPHPYRPYRPILPSQRDAVIDRPRERAADIAKEKPDGLANLLPNITKGEA